MKIALLTAIMALPLIPALALAQQAPKPCFSIVVDLEMHQADNAGINETHHVEIAYRPGTIGDSEGFCTATSPTDCNFATMVPTHPLFPFGIRHGSVERQVIRALRENPALAHTGSRRLILRRVNLERGTD
jgi:hypothetical protein